MINRLEISWKLDGFVDEQRYYCSETAFTAETKPEPKVVLAGDLRTYTDTDIELGKTYYVAVGSVKNSAEKLSEVKLVRASGDEHWDKVVALLHFDGDLNDETGRVWTANGGVSVSSAGGVFGGCATFTGNSADYISRTLPPLGTDDFTIEFFIKAITTQGQQNFFDWIDSGNPAGRITIYQ